MFLRRLNSVFVREGTSLLVKPLSTVLYRSKGSAEATVPTADLIDKWKAKFAEHKVSEIQSSMNNILAHVLQKKRLDEVTAEAIESFTEPQLIQFEQLCECRSAHMPIQYIIGEWDFRDLTLKMQPPVFIPRPETEELVELILQQFDSKAPMRFMEVGCGSGAISLALLHALPKAVGTAIDQSQLACNLTKTNAIRHKFENRIRILQHKLTESSKFEEFDGALDLIVSNPPYVPNKDLIGLAPEIKLYEDLRALDGGRDGLDVIKPILSLAAKRLRKQGLLWLEVDPSHPQLIQAYLQDKRSDLQLKFVASYPDMFHKDRFVEICKL